MEFKMDERILYYIWLSSALRVGSRTAKTVLEHFGDIEKVFSAQKEDLKGLGLSFSDEAALCNKDLTMAKKYYEYCLQSKTGILCYSDSEYPERLKLIPNPPPLLYYKGRLKLLDDYPCITMVGTRSCSERGFRLAYETAFDAASKGAVIVNGLALGIDGACIAGCLDANGYAVGVLGCGIDRIYPEGNSDLFTRLAASGLILSEFPPFTSPTGTNFPVRNRVISALSLAAVIFEADEKSGAMITARHALEQGKRIFAVPGKPYDKSYSGPLELIKDGATVFTEADDVLTEYSMNFPHRINLANINRPSKDKLDAYVARFFKKDSDPDAPVNRRFGKKTSSGKAASPVKDTAATPVTAQTEPKVMSVQTEARSEAKTEAKSEAKDAATSYSGRDLSVLSPLERQVYALFEKSESLSPDEIASQGFKIDDILTAVTLLEIYGLIHPLPGGRFKKA